MKVFHIYKRYSSITLSCSIFSESVIKYVIKFNKFIGDAYTMKNEYSLALKYNKKACSMEEILNNTGSFDATVMSAKTVNHLGSSQFRAGNFELALEYFSKSLELTPVENKDVLARVHNNIGFCLTETHKYKEALRHFHDSLVLKQNDP